MTARIAGFVTRADAGLVPPRSVSRNIDPSRGGCGVHYGGPRQPCAAPGAAHSLCVLTWRNWQRYHMGTHRWTDLAYTGGFCNHGYALAGRGLGVRTAANGTDDGNARFVAFTWIGGDGQQPTPEAIDALEWWLVQARDGGAGLAVWPHRRFKPTGCPGDPLVPHCDRLDGRPIRATPPTSEEDTLMLLLRAEKDGAAWLLRTTGTPTRIATAQGYTALSSAVKVVNLDEDTLTRLGCKR